MRNGRAVYIDEDRYLSGCAPVASEVPREQQTLFRNARNGCQQPTGQPPVDSLGRCRFVGSAPADELAVDTLPQIAGLMERLADGRTTWPTSFGSDCELRASRQASTGAE